MLEIDSPQFDLDPAIDRGTVLTARNQDGEVIVRVFPDGAVHGTPEDCRFVLSEIGKSWAV